MTHTYTTADERLLRIAGTLGLLKAASDTPETIPAHPVNATTALLEKEVAQVRGLLAKLQGATGLARIATPIAAGLRA